MNLGYYYIYHIIEDSVKEVLYGPEVLLIFFIIEDSVKEVLYGPEVLLQLFYHRRFCSKGVL